MGGDSREAQRAKMNGNMQLMGVGSTSRKSHRPRMGCPRWQLRKLSEQRI